MNWLLIVLSVYAFIVLVLIWRNTVLTNRGRAALLIKGVRTSFSSFIPLILKESFLFPFSILWNGLYNFLKELK